MHSGLVLASFQDNNITSTLPCLAETLFKIGLINIKRENILSVGTASHPTISDYKITEKGIELIKELNLK